MTDNERVGDIVKGVVPAIWISLGLVVLLCAIFCTIGVFSGKDHIGGAHGPVIYLAGF